jgi:hypothetical protein
MMGWVNGNLYTKIIQINNGNIKQMHISVKLRVPPGGKLGSPKTRRVKFMHHTNVMAVCYSG